MQTRHPYRRLEWRIAAPAALIMAMSYTSTVAQQPCNPVIDGTYCATQMPRTSAPTQSRVQMQPIQEIGSAMSISSIGQDTPGTFGGISFRGGSTCIGLLRRGACN
jgi:hypothetical protein